MAHQDDGIGFAAAIHPGFGGVTGCVGRDGRPALCRGVGQDPRGSDRLRQSRGTGAVRNCVDSSPNVEITALGDLFQDRDRRVPERAQEERRTRSGAPRSPWKHADKVKVTPERCFTGFDAYKNVIASGSGHGDPGDPAAFRPTHLEAAVEAGKHVFMEKPVAVDPAGFARSLRRPNGEGKGAGHRGRHAAPPQTRITSRSSSGSRTAPSARSSAASATGWNHGAHLGLLPRAAARVERHGIPSAATGTSSPGFRATTSSSSTCTTSTSSTGRWARIR